MKQLKREMSSTVKTKMEEAKLLFSPKLLRSATVQKITAHKNSARDTSRSRTENGNHSRREEVCFTKKPPFCKYKLLYQSKR